MRLIVVSLLVVLVSSASLRAPVPLPGQLAQGVGKPIRDALDTLRLINSQISNVRLQQGNRVATDVNQLINTAESEAGQLLVQHGRPDAVSTVHQAAQALHALADGTTGVEAGLQSALTEILMVIHQLGATLDTDVLEETTTPKSQLDQLLEELQGLVDTYLPLIAPFIGLTEKQALQVRRQFDQFVTDVEALEHGQVPVTEGLQAMVTDILEILKILGIDWTAPTDDTPTDLDTLLAELDSALTAVLDILGPFLGFTRERTEAIEADIDTLIADIEAIEHGHIDVDGGLEVVVQDIVDMLHDFGFKSQLDATSRTAMDDPSPLDVVLDELRAVVDTYLPMLGPVLGLSQEQIDAIVNNFDQFVTDAENLEHGRVDISTGLEGMVTDMLEIFKAFGLDYTNPTDDTPTSLDELLKQLEMMFDSLLDKLGPLLDLTPEQVAQAEADVDTLIGDLKAIEHGAIDVDGGLEKVVVDIFNILKDFGLPVQPHQVSEVTTPKSDLDETLEFIEEYLLVFLPAVAPMIGISFVQVFIIEKNYHNFVKNVEGIEHGTIEPADGVVYIIIDILNVLEAFDVDVTLPTDETPSSFDVLLEELESGLTQVLNIIGPLMGLSHDQILAIEADIDNIIRDFETIEHGAIDVDSGLEALLLDLLKFLHDLGLVPDSEAILQSKGGVAGQLAVLRHHLVSLEAARAAFGTDLRQLNGVLDRLMIRYV